MQADLVVTIEISQRNMKKHLLIVAIALCCTSVLSAQEQVVEDTLGQHPWKRTDPVSPKTVNWTMYIFGGGNLFDGDYRSEEKHAFWFPSAGAGVEYSFTPTWGIGLEYTYDRYRVTGADNPSTAPILLNGQMHRGSLFFSFDIFNAWRPMNKYKIFTMKILLGGGVNWFKNDLYYPNVYKTESDGVTPRQPLSFAYQTATQEPAKDEKFGRYGHIYGGATFEFNVARSIAIGLRATYSYFTKDEVDGRARGNNNDGMADFDLMLRYKFGAKHRSHLGNIPSEERLLNNVVMQAARDGRDAQANLRGVTMGPKGVEGLQNITNVYGSAGKDTVVVYHRDTVVLVQRIVQEGTAGPSTVVENTNYIGAVTDYYYVYFDNWEAVLYDQALITIQQVASRMKREGNLFVEITGYCDNTGSNSINNSLGMRRAKNVADELIQEYGIDPGRIKVVSKGIIRGLRSKGSYAPNRRVELHVMTQHEFELINSETNVPSQTVPSDKSVIVDKNTTLAKLARKYYGNTHCWIYIYRANVEIIEDPNSLTPGLSLFIPVLTDKQKLTTREEAAEMYRESTGKDIMEVKN